MITTNIVEITGKLMKLFVAINIHTIVHRRYRIGACCTVLLIFFACATYAQSEVERLVEAVKQTYVQVQDYEVDLTVKVDITQLRVPKMKLHMYYKQPNKVHFKAERKNSFAMLPRQGLVFNPVELFNTGYDAVIQGKDTVGSITCTKLVLLARSDTLRLQRIVLLVDPILNVIRRMRMTPNQGKKAQVTFDYTLVENRYPLPSRAVFRFDASSKQPDAKHPASRRLGSPMSGSVTIIYSKYKVNNSIPDSIFEKE